MTAAHDEPVIPMPDVQDDPMEAPTAVEDIVADIPADTGTEAAEDEHEGFSGGPSNPSVLTQYADHVACSVWTGEERPELKLSSHGRKVNTDNRGLLSAFVKWWHRETSSFHLPVGELTITLDDVSSLLHLPVVGDLHAFEPLHVDDAVQMLVDLLMVSAESARAETAQCRGPYVRLQWSATNVHVVYLEALRDLSMTERYAWGVTALVHMYDQLNDASMSHNRQLDGYITLLWIATKKTVKSIHTPAYRERLDRLRIPDVCWIPYGEHRSVRDFHVRSCYFGLLRWGPVAVYYRPERVMRQFGYTHTIPAPPVDSWVSYDDIHDRWMHYSDHIVPAGEVCIVSGQCSSDYMYWFFRISHPFMTLGHTLDPLPHGHAPQPRVVPQVSQTNIPHVPEPGASSTSAEEPRHAVEVCDDTAEMLERHLSLGVVTSGSLTHEVIEEFLRLARSVTQDHLVYVRSKCRRRTDQA
ncbi:protein MAIN-LIKE 1-like [Glycine soja]|uniref:protein MAIN-LIKE 1-like n=1 Tax=Glycine max TaxID=3847 RepID=UPI0003DEC78A|nr:protein MAIN-LIKE 1-like [Glycine max]XP_028196639.1 protein MAIN-LIKE 1-like [Glycine soja]|eukprot:XP_006595282.1 protein MAIN-LIKE 1-like [Glycine max]